MDRFDVIQSFLALCNTSASPAESIVAGFREAVSSLGFRYFACFSHVDPLHPPDHAILVHNYPAAWVRKYSEQGFYRLDPVFRHAQGDSSPFFWDATFHAPTMTKAQKKLLAEAAAFGVAHGYTLPISSSWLPGALRASCSVVPDSHDLDDSNYTILTVLAHFLYTSLTKACTLPKNALFVELTLRERQCLVLLAQGKDEWTIGRILGLSSATVHYHVARLKQRFQVTTRAQAVFSGVMAGQLSYHDVHTRDAASRRDMKFSRHHKP